MKTILRKTLFTISLILGTFTLANANNNDFGSRAVTTNSLGQPEIITISGNNNNRKSDYKKQYKLAYNEEGKTQSKEVSLWNKKRKDWEKSERYVYTYNQNGNFSHQIVQKWDNKSQSWNNIGYMIYDDQNSYVVEK